MKILYTIFLSMLSFALIAQDTIPPPGYDPGMIFEPSLPAYHATGEKRTIKVLMQVSDSSGKVFVVRGYERQKQMARDVDPGMNGGDGYFWIHDLYLDAKKRSITHLTVWDTKEQ